MVDFFIRGSIDVQTTLYGCAWRGKYYPKNSDNSALAVKTKNQFISLSDISTYLWFQAQNKWQ